MNKIKDYREIKINDEEYPEKLRKISSAPKTLYVRGNLPDPCKKAVVIVGARASSDYGNTLSKTIAKILSLNNVEIISDLAIGIDSSSHIGAIEAEKPTYAVLGTGVDICYPNFNQNIYEYFEKLIYDSLTTEPLHIDEIADKVKIPIEKCINTLMSLELNGFVETTMANYYKLSNGSNYG